MNLLTIRNVSLPDIVQNERYASSGVSVLISFARVSIVSVNSPFLQSHRQRKMAARFFLHGDHLAKVFLLGTPLLRPLQYDRTFLRLRAIPKSIECFHQCNLKEQFSGYIIRHIMFLPIKAFLKPLHQFPFTPNLTPRYNNYLKKSL